MLVAIILLLPLYLADGFDVYWVKPERRCLYYNGSCVNICPQMMHPYHTRCDTETMSQRTCASRYIYSIGYTCGWSRCDCNSNYFLDEDLGKCVLESTCPILPKNRRFRKAKTRRFRTGKRVRLEDYEDPIANFHNPT